MSSPPGISGATADAPQQLAISNGVLLAAVIFLFMVVVFVFLLYLYAKRFLGVNPMLHGPSTPSSRFLFVGDDSPFPRRGLPASVLRSLPVSVFAGGAKTPGGGVGKGADDTVECAVCLAEVADGEKVRALPKCAHRFHVECIDMWFHSHDTCPLCRAPVGPGAADSAAAEGLPRVPREDPVEFPAFPTNVLFWGTRDDDDVANAGLGMPAAAAAASARSGRRNEGLVIDIPNRGTMAAGASATSFSPLPASRMPSSADELRSPMSARLRSLRRLLSRGKQAVVGASSSMSSPRGGGGDIEQGLAARPPKTPKTPPSSN